MICGAGCARSSVCPGAGAKAWRRGARRMTGSSRFQDVIDRGLGIAARQLGSQYTAFRPKTGMAPLDVMNRFLNLPAWFNREVGQLRPLSGWADACWNGVFDRAYTLPGDYLHGPLEYLFRCVAGRASTSTVRADQPHG